MMKVASSSHAGSELPPVDARLVAPESGFEIIEGRVVAVPPAHEPHGERHSKVNALLEAFVKADYNVACDMLTRTSETSDVAPDASVYPMARDAATGGRQLELLAFQVVASETLAHAATKAGLLCERGVRRVFAVDVGRKRVLEWSRDTEGWRVLPDDAAIEDDVFVAPLPVDALVKAAKADDAMAMALLAKGNPVLLAAEARAQARGQHEGREEGREEGRAHARRAVLAVMHARGLVPMPAQRARIDSCLDLDHLERWTVRAARAATVEEVFED
jgi:hypothetical protein